MATSLEQFLADNPDVDDAWAYLEALMTTYGLESLIPFVRDNVVQGRSEAEIVQRLRETPEYKTRFKAIIQRQEKKLPPLSEQEVLAYEAQATELMRSVGLPQGFYDQPDDFAKFLTNDISMAELNQRINDGYMAALNAPQEVRDELERFYNVGPGELAAYFLDENRLVSVLQKQRTSAEIAAQAKRTRYGALTREESEQLQVGGLTAESANQGFAELAQDEELYGALPGEAGQGISRQTQLATLSNDAKAKEEIEKKRRGRQSPFEGGASFASNREGYSGLGKANSKS